MSLVYVDANVLIDVVEADTEAAFRVQAVFRSAVARGDRFAFTDLTWMECRVVPVRLGERDVLALYAGVFGAEFMSRVELERRVFDLATELRAHAALKTPDALHLAAALVAGCASFWTRDQRLARAAAGRIALFDPCVSASDT